MPESRVLRPTTLLKKRLWHMCFPVNFAKFFRAPILQNAYGRLLPNNIIGRREYHFITLGDEMSPVEGFRAKITLTRKKTAILLLQRPKQK